MLKGNAGIQHNNEQALPVGCADERAELAAQEEQLLAALVAGGKPPQCIEESQIAAAASSLLRKRARTIARSHPELVAQEADFMRDMKAYAVLHPGAHPGGICSDAAQFKRFLDKKESTPNVGILARFKSRILRFF